MEINHYTAIASIIYVAYRITNGKNGRRRLRRSFYRFVVVVMFIIKSDVNILGLMNKI